MASNTHIVTALIPARDAGDYIARTVRSITAAPGVDEVLVVDDGSKDSTASEALNAGARVLRLARNTGKGGAVAHGVESCPASDFFLLVDADTEGSAAAAGKLLEEVVQGRADLAIGVLPEAGRKGGFGLVRSLARWGIAKATGRRMQAPLSGQRAATGKLLRSLELENRFGLETAMTIDALRTGARVVEISIDMDHRHTGRRFSGFIHRARQGRDVAASLWFRIPTQRMRFVITAIISVLIAAGSAIGGQISSAADILAARPASKVAVFSIPYLSLDDLSPATMPHLYRLSRSGSVGAMSIRTSSSTPSLFEGYGVIGASNRTRVAGYPYPKEISALAFDATERYEGANAVSAYRRRTGISTHASILHMGAPALQILNQKVAIETKAGALGSRLRQFNLSAAVVGNSDLGLGATSPKNLRRMAATAVMDSAGRIDYGTVGSGLLRQAPDGPYGVWSDQTAIIESASQALERASLVLIDQGDTTRAASFSSLAVPATATDIRDEALTRTDATLGRLASILPDDTQLLIISPVPKDTEAALTPVVMSGKNVPAGFLHSPATKQRGVVTITDVAPTILDRLGISKTPGMAGSPWSYIPANGARLDFLNTINKKATFREGIYLPISLGYIILQAIAYAVSVITFSLGRLSRRRKQILRTGTAFLIAVPISTFLLRLVPVENWGAPAAFALLIALASLLARIALTRRAHPLSPVIFLFSLNVLVIWIDLITGGTLQSSSILGYSPLVAGRYTGLGNIAFTILGTAAVLLAGTIVQRSRRRREAIVTVALFLAVIVFIDGYPTLGSDVGGIVTLFPAFALTIALLQQIRVSLKHVLSVVGATTLILGVITAVDLSRAPQARTHLGRLMSEVLTGRWSALTIMLERKVRINIAVLHVSIWTWLVPVATAFLLFLIVRRHFERILPVGSPQRCSALGALAIGLIGLFTNDSGVVIPAMTLALLLPFLIFLTALDPILPAESLAKALDNRTSSLPRTYPGQ